MPDVSLVSDYRPLQLADVLPESYASKNIEDWEALQSLFLKYRFKPEESSSTYVNLLLVNKSRYTTEGRKLLAEAFDKVCVFSDWGSVLARAETVPGHLRTMLPKHFFLAVPYIIHTVRGFSTYVPVGMDRHADAMPWYKRAGRMRWDKVMPMETFSFGKLMGLIEGCSGRYKYFKHFNEKLYMRDSRDERNMLMESDLDTALGGMLV